MATDSLLEPLRPVVVAAGVGDDSEVAQRLRLAVAIPYLALDGQGLPEEPLRLVVVATSRGDVPEVVQRCRLAVRPPYLALDGQ